jgi:hypothetical protein
MKKFILLYKGPVTPMENMTKEQGEKVMAGWDRWMQKVGSSMIDIGAPMANGKAVVDNGTTGSPTELSGYSLIQAESMDEALKLVEDHPFLSDKTGEFSVEVFELMPLPV